MFQNVRLVIAAAVLAVAALFTVTVMDRDPSATATTAEARLLTNADGVDIALRAVEAIGARTPALR